MSGPLDPLDLSDGVQRWGSCRCGSPHRTARAFARCRLGGTLDHVTGDGPFAVLHYVRNRGRRPAIVVNVSAFAELDDAQALLDAYERLHGTSGAERCCGSCAGSARLVVILSLLPPGPRRRGAVGATP